MSLSKKRIAVLCAAAPVAYYAKPALAAAPIYGTTPFSNTVPGGYTGSTGSVPVGGPNSVSLGGYEIGNSNYYFAITSPTSGGRYTTGFILTPAASGTTTNLGLFPGVATTGSTPTAGTTPDVATSINTSGTLVAGYSNSYHYTNASGTAVIGNVEAVWTNAASPISLPVAVTDNFNDGPNNTSGLINNSGTVVGGGTVYNTTTGTSLPGSSGAFVWTNSGTVATPSYTSYAELVSPSNSTGSLSTGMRTENVFGISDSGLAVGAGSQFNGTVSAGNVAVTWDTTSTPTTTPGVVQKTIAPVLLTSPSLSSANAIGGSGNYTYLSGTGSGTGTVAPVTTTSQASFVNASNVIAGTATVYDANTANAGTGRYNAIGSEPIIWNGAGSTGTFLPLAANYTAGNTTGINVGGNILGNIQGTGLASGVVWKAGSSAPTLLAVPTGTNPVTGIAYSGFTFSKGINDVNYSVGELGATVNNSSTGYAMLWDPQGNATDLDTLVPLVANGNGTTAGWVSLLVAEGISDDGYISGVGIYYDPNASNFAGGGLSAGEYDRAFEILDTAAVPEPASLAAAAVVGGLAMTRRRRTRDSK